MIPRPDLTRLLRQLDELGGTRDALKTKSTQFAALSAKIDELRQQLPTAILKHYDQRRALNKPAIAAVKRGICGGCHISMTRSSAVNLQRNDGKLNVCENCGVFIYLDDNEIEGPESSAAR
jgi:predicted  nucleic acid-binding Zn-ribbon protein